MPRPGLSLVGFLDNPAQAIAHLRYDCCPQVGQDSNAALEQAWRAARHRRGPAFADAGQAEPQPLPDAARAYVEELAGRRWVADSLRDFGEWSFRLVRIDPLICYQMTVGRTRMAQLGGGCAGTDLDAMLPLCLPMAHPAIEHWVSPVSGQSSSVLVKSPRGDLHIGRFGLFGAGTEVMLAGARLYVAPPFVHVVRVDERCYLLNGYHRLLGARLAGATHAPCVFRDLPDLATANIPPGDSRDDPLAISVETLTSDNPPTMGHFAQGRAHEVVLRAKSRVIQVSWHQYTVPEE